MLNYLRKNFSPDLNYTVTQKSPDEINTFIQKYLYERTQFKHKKELWGVNSKKIAQWGKYIGWVPDQFPLIFLSETYLGQF